MRTIYLIQNIVILVILWNIITILNNCFLFKYIFLNVSYSFDGNVEIWKEQVFFIKSCLTFIKKSLLSIVINLILLYWIKIWISFNNNNSKVILSVITQHKYNKMT